MLRDFSRIKALIFDMDGVLFLSSGCHEKAYRETLAAIGITDFSYSSIAGMRTDEAMKKILLLYGRNLDEAEVQTLAANKRKKVLELLAEGGEVAPGSAELLARLSRKYRLALASSASPQTVEFFFRKSGYADIFEFVLNGSSVISAKPDPEIYALAVQKLGLELDECVVIEDAVSGVQAACSAGIPVITIAERRHHEEFAHLKPIVIVSNVAEIEPFLLP